MEKKLQIPKVLEFIGIFWEEDSLIQSPFGGTFPTWDPLIKGFILREESGAELRGGCFEMAEMIKNTPRGVGRCFSSFFFWGCGGGNPNFDESRDLPPAVAGYAQMVCFFL